MQVLGALRIYWKKESTYAVDTDGCPEAEQPDEIARQTQFHGADPLYDTGCGYGHIDLRFF